MKEQEKFRTRDFITISLVLLILTVISVILGVMMFFSNSAKTHMSLLRVEMTDFTENIDYSIRLGKTVDTYYGMDSKLKEAVRGMEDIQGLYVVARHKILFATDEADIPDGVKGGLDEYALQGEDFYCSMPISGGAFLVARGSSLDVTKSLHELLKKYLVLVGLAVVWMLLYAVMKMIKNRRVIYLIQTFIIVIWLAFLSVFVGLNADAYDKLNTTEIFDAVEASVKADLTTIEKMRIKKGNIVGQKEYLDRFAEAIPEVKKVTLSKKGEVTVVADGAYNSRKIIDYLLQSALLLALSVMVLLEYSLFTTNLIKEGGQDESIS